MISKISPKSFFLLIAVITFLFCIAIGFDVTPLLRGPAPYPPEWQWPYLFVNTLSKIYAPLAIVIILIGIFLVTETKKFFEKKTALLLCLLILLSFLFQMSLLYFSRSGIPVLIHRIINPDLNSYFTASLAIHNPIDFLKNYVQEMQQFVYHARSHPPLSVYIFYFIKQLILPFTFLTDFVTKISPAHSDVKVFWDSLMPIDKATAFISAFLLPFLTTLAIIPLYLSGKILYGIQTARRSLFLFILLPSIVFFIPINDTFLPFFSICAFYFLLKGLQNNSLISFFLSGIILFLGVSFNLALLPLLLMFFLFAVFFLHQNKLAIKKHLKGAIFFTIGFFITPILLFFTLNFNSIHLIQFIFEDVPHVHTRSYSTWLFYNLYDFFVFAGLPLALIFLIQIKKFNKKDLLFVAFFITLFVVDLTGSTRGETGRIWAPYLPFLLLPAVAFLTKAIKFSTKLFTGILVLQAIQILVMQEFWVMLW